MRVVAIAGVTLWLSLGGCIGDDEGTGERPRSARDETRSTTTRPPPHSEKPKSISRPLASTCGDLGLAAADSSESANEAVARVADALQDTVGLRWEQSPGVISTTFAITLHALCERSHDAGYPAAARARALAARVVRWRRAEDQTDFLGPFLTFGDRVFSGFERADAQFAREAARRCAKYPQTLRVALMRSAEPGRTRSPLARRLAASLRDLAGDLETLAARSNGAKAKIITAAYLEDLRRTAAEVIALGKLHDTFPRSVYRDLAAGRQPNYPAKRLQLLERSYIFDSHTRDVIELQEYMPTEMDQCALYAR